MVQVVELPAVGAYVRVRWADGVTVCGEVEDHAADGCGFDLGFVFAELAELDAVEVLG